MLTAQWTRAWALLPFCFLCGCGPKFEKLPTVPVSGTVTYNGRPVSGARISFLSTMKEGRNATGTTDSSGSFTLSTYLGGTQKAAGAMPGDYTVTVSKRETLGTGGPPSDLDKIREENTEQGSSEAESAAPKPGTSPPLADMTKMMGGMEGKSLVPKRYEDAAKSDLKATVKPAENEPFKFELVD